MGKGKNSLLSDILRVMFIFLIAVIFIGVIFLIILRFAVSGNKVIVPDVMGKNFQEAFDILTKNKLSIKIEGYKFSADFPEGYIVEQRPLPNQTVKEARVIKVFLSQGGETQVVPRVIGEPVSDFESILRVVGLEVGSITRVHSDDFPQSGMIIAQTPPSNIKVLRGSKINLLVSMGAFSSQLTVPDLGGMQLQDAQNLLESTGFKLGQVTRSFSPVIKEPNVVLEQTPQPNELADRGTSVNLVINEVQEESSDETSRPVVIRYKIPGSRYTQEGELASRHVKIVLEHEGGTRVVIDKNIAPGTLLEYPVRIAGRGVAKVYVDNMEWPAEILRL